MSKNRPIDIEEARIASGRFWVKVRKGGPDECWLWMAYKMPHGYGHFGMGTKANPRMVLAHRFSYVLKSGVPIPPGMCVMHICDNPSCVNPAHLVLGTHRDNTQDMITKGRSVLRGPQGERSGHAKITDEQAVEIKRRRMAGETSNSIAKDYNMSACNIQKIGQGTAWKHIKC